MGYVISYESLRDIYEQMSSVIEKTSNERIPKIRAALDEFINEDSMQGETADTIKEYLTYTHMVILQGICEVCSQFLVKFRLYQDGYYNIDSHENALLDEGAINFVDDLVKDFVRKESNLTDSFKLEARAISDIFSEPVPSDDNIRDISDIIKRRNENLHNAVINHERSHKNALSDVEELIISLKATIDSCKKSIGNFTIPLDNLKVVVENMKEIEEFQINSASEIEDAFYRQEAIVKEIFLEKQAEEREERGFWKCVAGTVTIVTGGVAIVVSGGAATPIVLGAATVAFGTSDVVEGSQDIHYGSIKDITSKSFNPLRDTVFAENQRLYDMTESVVTFASGASIPLSGSKALTFSSKARIVGTEAVKEFTGIAGGFVGEDLGENLGFSKEQSMMLGILASIASAKGVDSLHKNYRSIKGVGNPKLIFNNVNEYYGHISDIGKRTDITNDEKLKLIQEAYEALGSKKGDVTCISDIKYITGFDSKTGRPIVDWPVKMGFAEDGIKGVTRDNPLPNQWDRIGTIGGENFTTLPYNRKPFSYDERAIPYIESTQARHVGEFNNENYFDIIDAIADNDINKLNDIMAKTGMDEISNIEFKAITKDYTYFIGRVRDELGNIDGKYGLKGNVAPWKINGEIHMQGGAEQIVTPVKGNILERLGVLKVEF